MLLHDLIFNSARTTPEQRAVVSGNESLDYRTLADELKRVAAGLVATGVKPGDRVGIYLNKRLQTVLSYFGTSCAGAVFVPINPTLKAPQVAHILQDCDVVALITTSPQAALLADVLPDCKALANLIVLDAPKDPLTLPGHVSQTTWAELLEAGDPRAVPVRRIDNDIAAILYTSGSTGKPKGVVLSQRNMVSGAIDVSTYLENTPDDIILAVLPFSFDAGFSQMTTAFAVGATVVLMDYLLPRDVIKAAVKHRATGLTGVPPLWTQLARLDWSEEAVNSLRYFANTGGAMPTAVLNALRERLPKTTPFLMYGLTEAFRSTYLPPEEVDRRPTSMGKAIPNAEIMVVRDDGTRCDPGEPGELVHRGALVSLGYWNDPERTALRFRPAPGQPQGLPFPEIAVYSGDTVKTDDEGFLYFVGRKDDMIKSSGYRISPMEVEEVIYGSGLVNECAALGIPHLELGQAVVIACFTDTPDDATTEALLLACRKTLPNYMVPSRIVFRDTLPRNPNGKIDRKQLAAELAGLFREAD